MTSDATGKIETPKERQLSATATMGWKALTVLGVSYVMAGEFAGWNFAFITSSFSGLMGATALVAVLFFCLMLVLAEMACMFPSEVGAQAFVEISLGPSWGFLATLCVVAEYICGAAVVNIYLTSYLQELTGINGISTAVVSYALFVSIHARGMNMGVAFITLLMGIAFLSIIAFSVPVLPGISLQRLNDALTMSQGSWRLVATDIWNALPFAMVFFVASEGVSFASQEARDPARDFPRAMLGTWVILVILSAALPLIAVGSVGVKPLLDSDSPLLTVMHLQVAAVPHWLSSLVSVGGVLALGGAFFSLIFAYSRLLAAVAARGHLPNFLSRTDARGTPYYAVLLPSLFALGLTITGQAANIAVIAMLCATLSHILIVASFVQLRRTQPTAVRPYRAPAGRGIAAVAILIATATFLAAMLENLRWSVTTLAVIVFLFMCFVVRAMAQRDRKFSLAWNLATFKDDARERLSRECSNLKQKLEE